MDTLVICGPCKVGGDYSRSAKLIPDVDKTETLRRGVEIGLRRASLSHAECVGCDCQHQVISIDQLRQSRRSVH